MLDLFVKGGPVMVLITLSALCATVIIIERFLFFRAVAKEDAVLLARIGPLIKDGSYGEAVVHCESSDAPLAALAKAGLEYREFGESGIKEAVMNAANREVPRLERYIGALGTIANVSTLLGLLGTVSGNIRAFGVLASSGAMGNPALLAGAIAEALITTAAGLIVSIPAMIFHNYFVSRSNKLVVEMESSVGDLVLLIARDFPEGKRSGGAV